MGDDNRLAELERRVKSLESRLSWAEKWCVFTIVAVILMGCGLAAVIQIVAGY